MHPPNLRLLAPEQADTITDISAGEITELEPIAKRFNLLMLLYTQLQRHTRCGEGPAADFLSRYRSVYLMNAARSARQEVLGEKALSLLREQGIPTCLIKGDKLAREIYGDPNSRTSSDIDILVRAGDITEADRLLTASGYTRCETIPLRFWLTRLHHALYRGPGNDNYLEVHWNFSVPAFFRLRSDEIWNEITRDESGRLVLSPEMTVIHMLIHHYMHVFRDLKILVDVFWTLSRYDKEIDWEKMAGLLCEIGLMKTTLITLSQMSALWPLQSSALNSCRMLKEAIGRRGIRASRMLITFFEMDVGRNPAGTGYQEQVVKRFALDRWTTICLSFIRVLIPLPEAIKAFYGDDRNWMLPLNYMRFIFWRMKEWKRA